MHWEKGVLSSLEDDSSLDESPSGDRCTVLMELPVDRLMPVWRKPDQWFKGKKGICLNLTSLAHRLVCMSFSLEPDVPSGGPALGNSANPRE